MREVDAAFPGLLTLPPAKLQLGGFCDEFRISVGGTNMGCSEMCLATLDELDSSYGTASISPEMAKLDELPVLELDAPFHLECGFRRTDDTCTTTD